MSEKPNELIEPEDENYDPFADPLAWENCLVCGALAHVDSMVYGECEECQNV